MKTAHLIITCFLITFLFSYAVPANSDEYYLYAPKPVETAQVPPNPADGVLVKNITIRRGDTLSALSREYAGRGAYYPQILLFNKIKNPNRIFAGNKLLVPLQRTAKAETFTGKGKRKAKSRRKARVSRRARATTPSSTIPRGSTDVAEQTLYINAVKLFENREYQKSLAEFSGFLTKYPNSSHVADAMLYRAECYAKLSGR
jgi:LysM repeat protein